VRLKVAGTEARVATSSPGAWKYWPEIDGLRVIAVFSVFIFHLNKSALPGGFAGVDIFFIISGYLISSILLDDLAEGNLSIAKFYQRRIA
jgi:peptidoglycan/LPS O-acetylase OafA/YrhL